EDARTAAMLVQGTIAQRVELRSGPKAAQQAQGAEAVGDKRDQVDLQASQAFLQPPFAARGLDRFGKLCKRDNMAVDETGRNESAQKRTRIIRRNFLHDLDPKAPNYEKSNLSENLEKRSRHGALLQDVLEFWRNPNLSQPRGKIGLGWLLNLPGALESDLKCSQ